MCGFNCHKRKCNNELKEKCPGKRASTASVGSHIVSGIKSKPSLLGGRTKEKEKERERRLSNATLPSGGLEALKGLHLINVYWVFSLSICLSISLSSLIYWSYTYIRSPDLFLFLARLIALAFLPQNTVEQPRRKSSHSPEIHRQQINPDGGLPASNASTMSLGVQRQDPAKVSANTRSFSLTVPSITTPLVDDSVMTKLVY